jgi:kynureninase
MRVGSPPIMQPAALEAALDVWDLVDMNDLRAQSLQLSDLFISVVEACCPELKLATPREHEHRGSHVSFRHPEGYAIMQAVISEGVIGDFRVPDILRFGITPLYIGSDEVRRAISIPAKIMAEGSWDRPEFKRRARVI